MSTGVYRTAADERPWRTHGSAGRGQGPVEAGCAERRMGGETLVPLARPRIGNRRHEVPLELTDTGVVPNDLILGLIQVLLERRGRQEEWRESGRKERQREVGGGRGYQKSSRE